MSTTDEKPTLLLYNALSFPPFRSVKLRTRRAVCIACGENPLPLDTFDYVQFCGGLRPNWSERGVVEGTPGTRVRASVCPFSPPFAKGSIDTLAATGTEDSDGCG